MIRFCDSDVGCAEYDLLNRGKLISYFLSGHIEELVCVYNGSNAENFVGIITYESLLNALSIDGAILKEYVILDHDIWRNAREIFKKRSRDSRKSFLLPVLSKDYELICFAYQDEEANRELRMLRELKEKRDVLQFSNVFPQYQCVKIHEFNELAFFFAEYLREQKIKVNVDGFMWQDLISDEEYLVPEYECLHIYAEGTWEKTRNWKENLLRSVSVEFECVDKIYEANIKSGLIQDNDGEEYRALFARLRGEKEVIVYGTDVDAQNTYDFLTGNGIKVNCFVVDELNVGCKRRMFGKRIIGLNEVMRIYTNPIFIEGASKHSAWGIGSVDYYDYIGYKRNKSFITLRDYVEIPENNLLNALKNIEVVLAGDRHLCDKLYEYLVEKEIHVTGYLQTLQTDMQSEIMPEVLADAVDNDIMCLIVEPIHYRGANGVYVGREEQERWKAYLREKNINNYTDYFCDIIPFINIEREITVKYKKSFEPKRIVLGSILDHSGNTLLRSILDSHPTILLIQYCDLNNWLFWICVRLSMESSENILPRFWKLIEGSERSIVDKPAFIRKLKSLLACDSRFTSQELFVIFHIAYMYMFGIDVTEDNIGDMIIYWEPHFFVRDKLEECVEWLGTKEVRCDIINVVRNSIQQKGSQLKLPWCFSEGIRMAYDIVLERMNIEQKEYEQGDRLIVKFEDLKCSPREVLENICARWNIMWSDTLMQTTRGGKEDVYTDKSMQRTTGFDLRPVYNTCENFFSEFDRLKLMIFDAAWRKKYGYPYLEPDQFTRKELQEMFLTEFRFEKPGDTTGLYKERFDLDHRINLQIYIRSRLKETRCLLYANAPKD